MLGALPTFDVILGLDPRTHCRQHVDGRVKPDHDATG
jgi:hypothetical protein